MASSTDYRIDTDSPAGGDLLFWSLIGHEALSRPSVYELTVLSANPDIQAADILGRSFDVAIGFEDADGNPHERHCQGMAVRFARLHALGRYHEYRIELRSWFWLLHKRRNSRILGDDKDEGAAKNVLEILDIVLENSPIRAIKKLKSDGLGTHDARGYSVQYQESDYHYLSRLLEDEGIYYWFDAHAEPGTMRLADNAAVAHEPLPVADTLHHAPGGASEARFNDVWRWESERKLDTGWFDSRDSNYRKIRTKLGAIGADLEEHELADFEEFEFPGGYQESDESEVVLGRRVDELRSRRERHWVLTGWPDVAPGSSFTYEGDPDASRNGKYLIGGCIVVAVHPGHESVPRPPSDVWAVRRMLDRALENDAVNGDTADTLRRLVDSSPSLHELVVGTRAFLLTAWPLSVPYKPPRLTPRVRMPGPQSAIVVGPKGEEIPENGEDLYVDPYGRVKVFFHWNRYEKGKKDFDGQKWTCWLRVSQPWAGKKWGGYFAPRIGQEVIVDFLDGDPDRPLITGRVYNDDQPIPYASPTQSGFKTRSTPNGKPANYNEIMFEDKKGQENLNIHAERNMSRSVEVDDSTSVGHDQNITVKNYQWTSVGKYRSVVVEDGNEDYTINGHRGTYVQIDDKLTVDGSRSLLIDKGQYTTVTAGEHKLVVKAGNKNSFVTGDQLTWVSAGYTLSSMTATVNVGAALTLSAGSMAFGSKGSYSLAIDGTSTTHAKGALTVTSDADIAVGTLGANIDLIAQQVKLTSFAKQEEFSSAAKSAFTMGFFSKNTFAIASDNFLGLQLKNSIGAALSNTLAIQLSTVVGPKIEKQVAGIEMQPTKHFMPGGGGDAAGATSSLLLKTLATAVAPIVTVAGGAANLAWGIAVTAQTLANEQSDADKASALQDARARVERSSQEAREAVNAQLTALIAEANAAGKPAIAERLQVMREYMVPASSSPSGTPVASASPPSVPPASALGVDAGPDSPSGDALDGGVPLPGGLPE